MNVEAEVFKQRLVSPEAREAFAAFFEKTQAGFLEIQLGGRKEHPAGC